MTLLRLPDPPDIDLVTDWREEEIVSMETVTPRRWEWVWEKRIPRGALTIIDGVMGVGKSTLAVELAARITRGERMPFSTAQPLPPSNVLFMTAEDSIDATFAQRLRAAEADLGRVKVWKGIRVEIDGVKRLNTYLALDVHYGELEAAIVKERAVAIFIDVLFGYVGTTNPYIDNEVREFLAPLVEIAERNNCAIVAIRHPRKGQSGEAAHEIGGGSVAWGAVARSVLYVAKHPEEEGLGVITPIKMNLVKDTGTAQTYRIIECFDPDGFSYAGRVDWIEEIQMTAGQLLAGNKARVKAERQAEEPSRKWRECEDVIEAMFAGVEALPEDGGVKHLRASLVKKELVEKGFSAATIDQAKRRLKIKTRKMSNFWRWDYTPPCT